MQEKTIEFEELSLPFTIEEDKWQLQLPKSQTRVKDFRQIRMLTEAPEDIFVPAEAVEEKDSFIFTFTVDQTKKNWDELGGLYRNEKLRLLCNVGQLKRYLSTRLTFFLHPDNLVFDDSLQPFIIHRGIRDLVPPFNMEEQDFLKQLQCLSIALFSRKYNFDQLYNGALQDADETEFERQVSGMTELEPLLDYLQESYRNEQHKTEKNMQMIPVKRFRFFKYLSIIMIVVAVLLAAPLVYFGFFSQPHQQHLLDAHEEYLASDYGEVISTLEKEKPDKLPKAAKYILADSYINTADLNEESKENILKSVSLKSDKDFLLFWILYGRGKLDEALDKAKYLDEPSLIMYGLLELIEDTKNDPDLDGSDRDEKLKKLNSELDDYREEYGLDDDEEETEDEEHDSLNDDADDGKKDDDEADSDKKKDKDKKDKSDED